MVTYSSSFRRKGVKGYVGATTAILPYEPYTRRSRP